MKKENLIAFYQNYQLYIFPIIVALSSLFLMVFAIYPQTAKLISNQKTVGDLINKSKFLETKALALESLDGDDLSKKVGFAVATFPADKDLGSTIGILQQLAAEAGFVIDSITLGNSSDKVGNSDSFEVKMEIKGIKNKLDVFLNTLESSAPLMRLDSINVSSGNNSQVLDASLTVKVLYAAAPQNFGSVDSPLTELSQKDEEMLARLARVAKPVSQPSTISVPASSRGKSNPFE